MGAGTDAVSDLNVTEVAKSLKLTFTKVYRSGEDIVVEGKVYIPSKPAKYSTIT